MARQTALKPGYLRQPDNQSTIAAADDLVAIRHWLAEIAAGVDVGTRSRHTLAGARRNAERLVLWASIERGKPISDLRRDDAIAYHKFLLNPQPAEHWCGKRVAREHADWGPFSGPLKASSANQVITVIHGLFAYLVRHGYLSANPFADLKQVGTRSAPRDETQNAPAWGDERVVDPVMWQAMMAAVERWPRATERQAFHYERARFVLSFLYLLAPRLSDLAGHVMGDLEWRTHDDGTGGWWWKAVGKGRKRVMLPVPADAMAAVARWRRAQGLAPEPRADETQPLIARSDTSGKPLGRAAIYKLVKRIAADAAQQLAPTDPQRAARLADVSPHWLRHTALTRLAETLPLEIVARLARHSDIRTTTIYVHTGTAQLFQAAQTHTLTWGGAG